MRNSLTNLLVIIFGAKMWSNHGYESPQSKGAVAKSGLKFWPVSFQVPPGKELSFRIVGNDRKNGFYILRPDFLSIERGKQVTLKNPGIHRFPERFKEDPSLAWYLSFFVYIPAMIPFFFTAVFYPWNWIAIECKKGNVKNVVEEKQAARGSQGYNF